MAVPRIPYTSPFPPPKIRPGSATSLPAAVAALLRFLNHDIKTSGKTLLLTGAGISVASGLADYRGEKGTYRLNQNYRPIFYSEFVANHAARKRYWARSFLGWPTMERVRPNRAHWAVSQLAERGLFSGIITQNVDSLHHLSHPQLKDTAPTLSKMLEALSQPHNKHLNPPIVEIHGTLRHLTCLTCASLLPRSQFQATLNALNPAWAEFLRAAQEAGAFEPSSTHNERIKTNPDGDVDLPGAPYSKFRYPPCPKCLEEGGVEVDHDGAHLPNAVTGTEEVRTKGILKPSIIFFGESVQQSARDAADRMVEECDRILVLGSSLATYSAWKLVREAARTGKGIGIINLGGVRGEADFFDTLDQTVEAEDKLRLELPAADVLSGVIELLEGGKEPGWWADSKRNEPASSYSGLGG